jgi:hypothetical protein
MVTMSAGAALQECLRYCSKASILLSMLRSAGRPGLRPSWWIPGLGAPRRFYPRAGFACVPGWPATLRRRQILALYAKLGESVREPSLKARHLIVLRQPFSLDLPYAERQRVVIVADETVEAERLARARRTEPGEHVPQIPDPQEVSGGREAGEPAPGQSRVAVAGRRLHRGADGVRVAGAGVTQAIGNQAVRWAQRRQLGALLIGRSEAAVLHLGHGHPLRNVLYVGHPARPDLYFPAAEFHRRVFEHKFVEAVRLLTSLGARRIAVQQEQGYSRETMVTSFAVTHGFSHARHEKSDHGALFEAEFPGHRNPSVPDGLCWYADEQTWQMIVHARIADGAQKTALTLAYTTDYGINTGVVKAARACGVNIGGRFEEQRDTIWRLAAEFPGELD